jgi:hypothetical protein
MLSTDLIDQLLECLSINVGDVPNINVLAIQGAIGTQNVVAFAPGVTADNPTFPFLDPDITQADVMRRMHRIYEINPVFGFQGRFEFKIPFDKGFLFTFGWWVARHETRLDAPIAFALEQSLHPPFRVFDLKLFLDKGCHISRSVIGLARQLLFHLRPLLFTQFGGLTLIAPLAQARDALSAEHIDPFAQGALSNTQNPLQFFDGITWGKQPNTLETFGDASVSFMLVLGSEFLEFGGRQF